jgi:outer membrane lipoprotein-sorting protein
MKKLETAFIGRSLAVVLATLSLIHGDTGASATATQQPTGEQIIERFVEVTGGKEAYAKQESRVSTGTTTIVGHDLTGPITIYQKAPNLTRVTGRVGDVTFDRGFDGKTGFEVHSMFGARLIEGEERELMQLQSLASPLIDLAESYTRVENVGVEPIDDRDAYKVELTMKSGQKLIEWFDIETGLLAQMHMTIDSAMGPLELTIVTSDWRDCDGVQVPFKTTHLIQPIAIEQTIELTKVESNVDIPADKFELPEEIRDLLDDPDTAEPATRPTDQRR